MVVLSRFLLVLIASCGKGGAEAPMGPPANLSVAVTVSTDNSGKVTFTATAVNAVYYEFDLGNGVSRSSSNGSLAYRYMTSGTYEVTVMAKSAGGETASISKTVTVSVILALAWSDEFNYSGAPDPAKWGYDLGGGGWGNAELQYYTNRLDNASVSGGTLKVTALRENFSGSSFTSARLITRDKFTFQYGRLEVRAKLPEGAGTWPAIWMLGSNFGTVGWPACGEIDIMEHRGVDPNRIVSALHYSGNSGGSAKVGSVLSSNVSSEFHVYTLEWYETSITFMVDQVTFFSFANFGGLPFHQPFFLLVNVAMGGSFGGMVNPAFTSSAMEIDYIRVYN